MAMFEIFLKTRLNTLVSTGRSIPVVRALRVRKDWVRFPAARLTKTKHGIMRYAVSRYCASCSALDRLRDLREPS